MLDYDVRGYRVRMKVMGGHSHSHSHHHSHATGTILIVSLLVTLAFVAVEAIAGVWQASSAP